MILPPLVFPIEAIDNSDTRQSHVLTLATFGWHDINKNDPICITLPKVAKACKKGNIALQIRRHYYRHYCAKLRQCKYVLSC